MEESEVTHAYGRRAREYADTLGSLEQMHEADQRLIARWSEHLPEGPVLDLGCGPGHWTAHLHERDIDVHGIDPTRAFIHHARASFPGVPFHVGSFTDLEPDRSVSGILAWYSVIHTHPTELPSIVTRFSRSLVPGGHLLLGFFEGSAGEPFAHAITTAYSWSVDAVTTMLDRAEMDVVEIERREEDGARPHAAISAVARWGDVRPTRRRPWDPS